MPATSRKGDFCVRECNRDAFARAPLSSRKLDLPAAPAAWSGSQARTYLRHDDSRCSLAPHLASFVDRLLERTLDALGKLAQGLFHRRSLDLEYERQHTRRRQELRLPREQNGACRVGVARDGHGSEATDGARPSVGEGVFAIESGWVEFDVRKVILSCHGNPVASCCELHCTQGQNGGPPRRNQAPRATG